MMKKVVKKKDNLMVKNIRKEKMEINEVKSGVSSKEEEFSYDPEIERPLHRIKKETRRRSKEEEDVSFEEPREEMATNANLSFRQLGTPDLNQQPLCITFPTLKANATSELMSELINFLLSFHGLAGDDPHKHLMEFYVVCTSIKLQGVTHEHIQLKDFPFSLKNFAKDWLYYLPPGFITTWTEMKRTFLENYFPASRAANIRKKIYGIKQYMGESLHEYWERFKKLCARCPQYQISENILIQYCYEFLLSHDRSMVDAASGGVFVDKTPRDARNLIENMAANCQQFGTNKSDSISKRKNKVNVSYLEQQLIELMSLVHQMVVGNGHNAKVCGIYAAMRHASDMCPTLQDESVEQVNATGGFPGPPQRSLHLTCNRILKAADHRILHNSIALKFQPLEMRASIQNLNTQVGQLATAINKLEAQNSSILPTQTVPNPKENVSAITLRSGRELKVREEVLHEPIKNEDDKESKVEENEIVQEDASKGKFPPLSEYKLVPLFPLALKEFRKDEGIKNLYDIFRGCEVNIHLLDAIKQLPQKAIFFRKLCTAKRKQNLKGCQKLELGEQVSTVIQRKIPVKCKDPGLFSIPCKIGDVQLETAMLDLGASINFMSYSTYDSLKLGPLNETAIVIPMADRSTIYSRGVIEDVLVKVDDLVFPADFYVLDMKTNDLNSPILLGRPFLKTSKSIVDVNNGTLTMEFYGEIVKFNIFDTPKFPNCESVVNTLDINDHLSQENKKLMNEDKMKKIVARPAENSNAKIFLSDLQTPKTQPKLPPDRAKEIPMGIGKNHQEMGVSEKSKKRKHGPKLTVKMLKWVKVDKVIKYEPP
ncbi:uncharacterized protein [Henckelia pumila]|uniref:uncharacterized protein n=1 Tax=Henckelia pumila TaxID=405737 RepID=UPI003C6E068F